MRKYVIVYFELLVTLILCICMFSIPSNDNITNNRDHISDTNKNNNIFVPPNRKFKKASLHAKGAIIPTFTFHSIGDDFRGSNLTYLFVKTDDFDKYLKYISDNGYETVFSDEIDDIGNYTKPVAIDFDDGYIDFYTTAFPIIQKYEVKVTFFIISGMVGKPGHCTWEQLKEISNSPYVSIQSHTVSHAALASLSEDDQRRELADSKKTLEDNLNITVDTISYPMGSYNSTTIKLAKEIYKYGMANYYGIYNTNKQSKYEVPRVEVSRTLKPGIFEDTCKRARVEK